MTEIELQALLTEWQKRLRLQDWDVHIAFTRERDMAVDNSRGAIRWNVSLKEAWLHILDPIDYPPDQVPQDIEQTIIHELLHLHLVMVAEMAAENEIIQITTEQAIVCIAEALVRLKREGVSSCVKA